ncbi:MAG: aspartate aminotransferase family protein [Deltaproteobacteria bacterium]|nr:MAG: aspartate aminotransferase family protein [Deltaproteobacteria bacterium]
MSRNAERIEVGRRVLFQNYRQPDFVLVEGRGIRVRDADGNEYLDLIAGIATCGLGHCHPKVVAAVQAQAERLWHVSNLFWNEPNIRLAERLVGASFADRAFFCNSGAEANEAAIKLARRYHHDLGTGRYEIVSFEGGFHGRTLGALSATARPAYHEGFGPLPEGFVYAPYGDPDALHKVMGARTAAVLLEPLQGEGGLIEPPPGYLEAVRAACDAHGALMILDEVQSGMGRTGKLWAYEWEGIEPDIMSSAKALGNGFPIGAVLAREEVAAAFVPGTHASTYGGGPLASSAALAVLEVLLDEGGLEQGRRAAAHLWRRLETWRGRGPVAGLRGKGLWVGIVAPGEAKALNARAREAGVLLNAIGEDVVRMTPPLTVDLSDLDLALDRLEAAWGLA